MCKKAFYFGLISFQRYNMFLTRCDARNCRENAVKHMNKCKVWNNGLTSGRAGAGKSHQSSTKKLICFYGGAESLPPHLHLVALRSGRRGDTPPVGRRDALLKATWGQHTGPGDSPTPSLQLFPAEETGCQVRLRHIMLLYPLASSAPTPPWAFALPMQSMHTYILWIRGANWLQMYCPYSQGEPRFGFVGFSKKYWSCVVEYKINVPSGFVTGLG